METTAQFLSTVDLAKLLGKTPRYVRKLANQNLIPFIKLPNRDRLFDRAEVGAALQKFSVPAGEKRAPKKIPHLKRRRGKKRS